MNSLQRISLLIAAFGWGISAIAIFGNSNWIFLQLSNMGGTFEYHKMLDYWLRMTAVGFTFIGLLFGLSAFKLLDRKFNWILAIFQVVCGIILFIWIKKLNVKAEYGYGDVAFCIATGLGIIIGNMLESKKANQPNAPKSASPSE